jgi:hypothetical protein
MSEKGELGREYALVPLESIPRRLAGAVALVIQTGIQLPEEGVELFPVPSV